MNMKLNSEMADRLDDKISEIIAEAKGTYQTTFTEDISSLADSLSELSVNLHTISNYVEGKIEEAHLRRGRNIFGDALNEGQIATHRDELGHPWVATVSCECGAGEFCNTCGPDVLPSVKSVVSKFLES
jgi:hypothetical protein